MWDVVDGCLNKIFVFKDFNEAINFVNNVSSLAEKENHHPDILIYSYKNVKIMLKTHSENKITDKDYRLSKLIDDLV